MRNGRRSTERKRGGMQTAWVVVGKSFCDVYDMIEMKSRVRVANLDVKTVKSWHECVIW